MQRINKQMQREISLLLELRVKNETAKLAVITEVDCSRDLENARVYFTTVDPSIKDDVKKSLESVAGALRTMLGRQLGLRLTPALSFHVDTSEDYGRVIDRLLDSLKTDDRAETEEAGDDEEEYPESGE
jgi:ribosome-binding factor A